MMKNNSPTLIIQKIKKLSLFDLLNGDQSMLICSRLNLLIQVRTHGKYFQTLTPKKQKENMWKCLNHMGMDVSVATLQIISYKQKKLHKKDDEMGLKKLRTIKYFNEISKNDLFCK